MRASDMLRSGSELMSDYSWYAGVNRYVCTVLTEMRDQVKTLCPECSVSNRHLMSLIEEAQTCVNRMEGAMEDWSDIRRGREIIKKIKKERKKLLKELKQLKKEKQSLGGTND